MHENPLRLRATTALKHALRILDDSNSGWARFFMLSTDMSVTLAALTSQAHLANACLIFSRRTAVDQRSGKSQYEAILATLLVPVVTMDNVSFGIAVMISEKCALEACDVSQVVRDVSRRSCDKLKDDIIGRFCMDNETGELLMMASVYPDSCDPAVDFIALMLEEAKGIYMSVSEKGRSCPVVRVIWWAPHEEADGVISSTGWQTRDDVVALCDTALLAQGRYEDCIIMCETPRGHLANTCVMSSNSREGPEISVAVGKSNAEPNAIQMNRPDGPLDHTKLASNLLSVQGQFAGSIDSLIYLPGSACAVVQSLKLVLSISWEPDTRTADLLQKTAVQHLIQIAEPVWFLPVDQQQEPNEGQGTANITCDINVVDRNYRQTTSAVPQRLLHGPSQQTVEHVAPSRNLAPGLHPTYVEARAAIIISEREARLELRRERNRAAAARSNAKRREHRQKLERDLMDARSRSSQLRIRQESMAAENAMLRARLQLCECEMTFRDFGRNWARSDVDVVVR